MKYLTCRLTFPLVFYLAEATGGGPTDLVTSEVTHRSFRATWTAPSVSVDIYRVTYTPVAGGATQEVR